MLNILGLTLGITIGIILFLYLQHQLSYDQSFAKYDQIYRFTNRLKADGVDFNIAQSSRRLAPIIKEDLPEVINYARFLSYGKSLLKYDFGTEQKQFYQEDIWLTDSTVFELFDHHFYEGNPQTCLAGPGKVVLTKSVAEKMFGQESAMGKRVNFDGNDPREVTAVISDLPENTHLKYQLLLSDISPITWDRNGDAARISEVYWNPRTYTYLLFPKDYDIQHFYDNFPSIYDKTFKIFGERINGTVSVNLQRIDDIHFNSDRSNDEPVGNIAYVYTFTSIGIFIILLACINYMNMATARSVTRTGEMGIRKVLGYSRTALFGSVMFEAILMAFIAMILANILVFFILYGTPFNALIKQNLSLNYLDNIPLIGGCLAVTFIIGFVSGIYPALYIPSVPVVKALKGSFTGDRAGTLLRKSLITFQFIISIFVIICTVLMDRQITYMQNRDLGIDKDYLLLIDIMDSTTAAHVPAIKTELLKNPNILGTTNSYGAPGISTMGSVMMVEKDSAMVQQHMDAIYVGKNYLTTLGIEIVQGRAFREDSPADFYKSYLINETGAKMLGRGNEAVGKNVMHFHGEEKMKVIGVFKDFNFESLHSPIKPLFLILDNETGGKFYIKLKGTNLQETIAYVEKVWTEFAPNSPFEYTFLDQEFAKQYEADQTQQRLISILSYICIFISILGLIGLSAFTASRKAKEISIRKVLGANTASLVALFSKEYLKLIIIAFLIAVPLADYAIVEWMSDFAYRMDIHWIYYIIPGLAVLFLGLFTVGFQSLRSAKANPVDGLRSE